MYLTREEYTKARHELEELELSITPAIAFGRCDGLTSLCLGRRIEEVKRYLRKVRPPVFRRRRTAKMAVEQKLVYDSELECWVLGK